MAQLNVMSAHSMKGPEISLLGKGAGFKIIVVLALGPWFGTSAKGDAPSPEPLDCSRPLTKIVFASGADPRQEQPLWRDMLAEKPELLLWLGNNLPAKSTLALTPTKLAKLQSLQPDAVLFRRTVPSLATWDNSDFGVSPAAHNGIESAERESSKLEYLQLNPFDLQSIPAKQRGIYHSLICGPQGQRLQILILDQQSFRSPLLVNPKPFFPNGPYRVDPSLQANLLGKEQLQWLDKQLDQPADLRVLLSPRQFISDTHGYESWGLFPNEKKHLLASLQRKKIAFFLVLSANRLHGEVHRQTFAKNEVLDTTVGGLNVTFPSADQPLPTRIGELVNQSNFGLLKINWSTQSGQVELHQAKSPTGKSDPVPLKVDFQFRPQAH